jgi:hypothetical protein
MVRVFSPLHLLYLFPGAYAVPKIKQSSIPFGIGVGIAIAIVGCELNKSRSR